MSSIQLSFFASAPASGDKATGGTIYTPGNGYVYHMFLSPGTFSVLIGPLPVDAIVVAGGGSGGYASSNQTGGGGAGGVRYATSILLSSNGSYPISVGNGGPSPGIVTSDGSPSFAFGYIAAGGGKGASTIPNPFINEGGSGGGTTTFPGTTIYGVGNIPYTTPAQGYRGGIGISPSTIAGGGGGGAGGVGGNAARPTTPIVFCGNGGSGAPFQAFAATLFPDMPAEWIAAVGPTGLYGGGGAGGSGPLPTSYTVTATGGPGGGGKGLEFPPSGTPSEPGVNNTGGGGGGGNNSTRAGGNGIVIVRYAE